MGNTKFRLAEVNGSPPPPFVMETPIHTFVHLTFVLSSKLLS